MARVWREGQRRPVFVYRLVTAHRIEEAIYQVPFTSSPPSARCSLPSQRQRVKEGLHDVISLDLHRGRGSDKKTEATEAPEDEGEGEGEESDSELEEDEGPDQSQLSPLLADVWSLVWPEGPSADPPSRPGLVPCGDDLLDAIAVSCGQALREIIPILS
jgi:hypothetical protein